MSANTNEMMRRIKRTLVGGTVVKVNGYTTTATDGTNVTVPGFDLDNGAGCLWAFEFEDYGAAKALLADLEERFLGATIKGVVIHEVDHRRAIGVAFQNCPTMLRLRGVFPKNGDEGGWHYEVLDHPLTQCVTRLVDKDCTHQGGSSQA